MKQKLFLLWILSALICACGDDAAPMLPEDDNVEAHTKITLLDVEKGTSIFTREGGETTLTFEADGPWSAVASQDWLQVQPTSGEAGTQQLTITIPSYESEFNRSAELTIGKDANMKHLMFEQVPMPEVSPLHDFELTASPVRLTVGVFPGLDFEITLSEGAEQWITPLNTSTQWSALLAQGSGLNFDIKPNETDQPRTGTVTLSRQGRSYSFAVNQHHGDDLRPALMEFYHALDGEHWGRNDNWGTDTPLNDWAGLSINEGVLVALRMYSNNLKGEIPEAIGLLKTLETFGIVGNENVVGHLPESLGDLPCLRMLEITHNGITGPIPASLGKASKLETLWLCYNQLSGEIPGELGELPLEGLNLTGNNITGNIPEGLTKIQTINRLFLKHNCLSGTLTDAVISWLSGIEEALINPQQEGYGLTK